MKVHSINTNYNNYNNQQKSNKNVNFGTHVNRRTYIVFNNISGDEWFNIFIDNFFKHGFGTEGLESLLNDLSGHGFNIHGAGFSYAFNQNGQAKAQQKTNTQNSNPNRCTSQSPNTGWTRGQFISHIERKLADKNTTKHSLKDTELRNLAKLLEVPIDKILNLSEQDYKQLCKKFHPDVCPLKDAGACFRIATALYKLK